MKKKEYQAPAVRVMFVHPVHPLALSGGEQQNMGTNTNEDVDAGKALAPGWGRTPW